MEAWIIENQIRRKSLTWVKYKAEKGQMLTVTYTKGGVWNHETIDILQVVESSCRSDGKQNNSNKN